MIELEIDGKKIKVEPGVSIIEVADREGIYIPRFCYHNKLSIAANCRMCLVEVEKSPKTLPACATPVTSDMKVFTTSPKALEAQRAVMEYLLINHPLDCPICDQGGECELQDLAMGFGSAYSYYKGPKRSFYDDDLGPLIETEMTRCIQCTRCVRFGEEIAGVRELGVTNRGEREFISTYVKHFMQSELSGNIIDLCPVGALTAKPSRYSVRGWEVTEHKNIAPHDCVGSNIFIHSRFQEYAPQRKIMRVVPRQNESINETWISDRDRFSYEGLYHSDRALKPKIKIKDKWQDTDWETALMHAAEHLRNAINSEGTEQLALVASPNSTTEEFYILQKWMRELGGTNVDHRFREQDFRDQDLVPEFPNLGMSIEDIEHLKTIILVGSDIRYEQPLLNHRINKAIQEGANVFLINPIDYDLIFTPADKIIHANVTQSLKEIVKVLSDDSIQGLSHIKPSEKSKKIAAQLKKSKKAGIFMGHYAYQHPEASQIRQLIRWIAKLSHASIGVLTEGANTAGAWLAGMIPHRGPASEKTRKGFSAKEIFTDKKVKNYLLFNVEPEFDIAYSAAALQALHQAEFVICFSSFVSEEMKKYADIIFPVAPFTETDGTFINIAGTWQSFKAVSVPEGDSKSGWEIIQMLANKMHLKNFNYKFSTEIRDELENKVKKMQVSTPSFNDNFHEEKKSEEYLRVGGWSMYRTDPLVRRAPALQKTISPKSSMIQINQTMAEKLGFSEGMQVTAIQKDQEITLPLMINNKLSDGIIFLASGLKETQGFGEQMAPIHLVRAKS